MHTFQPNNNSSSDCISQELLHICPRRCLIRNIQGISWGSSGQDSLLSLSRGQVQSLAGKLRSHRPRGAGLCLMANSQKQFKYPLLAEQTSNFLHMQRNTTHPLVSVWINLKNTLNNNENNDVAQSHWYVPFIHSLGESNGTPLQYSHLENPMDGGAWWAAVHGVAKSRTRLSDFTLTFHLHALEKEMATHSSVLAWRIPGTGEPGGLLSMGSHRVGHD